MQRRDGRFVLLARADGDNAYLIEPRSGNARIVPWPRFRSDVTSEAAVLSEAPDPADHAFTLRSIAEHVFRHKAVFGPLIAASFFVNLLGYIYPFAFLIIIDKVISNRGAATLDVIILSLLFFLAFEAVLRGARHKALRHAVRDMDRSLLSRLIRHSLELPASFYLRNTPVETLSRIEELQHLRRFLTNAAVFVFVDTFFVLIAHAGTGGQDHGNCCISGSPPAAARVPARPHRRNPLGPTGSRSRHLPPQPRRQRHLRRDRQARRRKNPLTPGTRPGSTT